jgi:DNA-binding LytR/AlgR family response regulator
MAIDDEKLSLDLLEDNISKVPFLQLVGKSRNPVEALNLLRTTEVDLIFLDIQMPGLTGLQFLKSLPNPPMIIFVTAYENHAVDAFGLGVIDYLVKPVAFDRFLKACNKAAQQYQLSHAANVATQPQPASSDYIFVNADYSLLKITVNDIQWVEGLKDYIKIHLSSSPKPIVTRMTMKSVEEKLPGSRFVRIHKSYILSLSAITAIRKNSVFINSLELPISDNYKDVLKPFIGAERS